MAKVAELVKKIKKVAMSYDSDGFYSLGIVEQSKLCAASTIARFLSGKDTPLRDEKGKRFLSLNAKIPSYDMDRCSYFVDGKFIRANKTWDRFNIAAFILNQDETGAYHILLNADMSASSNGNLKNHTGASNPLIEQLTDKKYPCVSFRCLLRLIDPKFEGKDIKPSDLNILFDEFKANRLEIVDYIPDEVKKITSGEGRITAAFKKEQKRKGYTYLGTSGLFHHPATVLLKHTKNKKVNYFVLGVDEGQYFGCQLPADEAPTTTAAGLLALTPKSLRKKQVERQGEWFIVPVKASEVPAEENCLSFEELGLPRDNQDSAIHSVRCDHEDGRIKDDIVYARNFCLGHSSGEHQDIRNSDKKWYTFVRNTAVRSVSEAGVD
jgi:hypothetical protein